MDPHTERAVIGYSVENYLGPIISEEVRRAMAMICYDCPHREVVGGHDCNRFDYVVKKLVEIKISMN